MGKTSVQQGGIYMVNLNPVKGHEQAGFRPVLVLQNNKLNPHLRTVVVAPLTSNLQANGLLLTHFLSQRDTSLKKDSIVLLFQVRAIGKSRLKKHVSTLDQPVFREVKKQVGMLF